MNRWISTKKVRFLTKVWLTRVSVFTKPRLSALRPLIQITRVRPTYPITPHPPLKFEFNLTRITIPTSTTLLYFYSSQSCTLSWRFLSFSFSRSPSLCPTSARPTSHISCSPPSTSCIPPHTPPPYSPSSPSPCGSHSYSQNTSRDIRVFILVRCLNVFVSCLLGYLSWSHRNLEGVGGTGGRSIRMWVGDKVINTYTYTPPSSSVTRGLANNLNVWGRHPTVWTGWAFARAVLVLYRVVVKLYLTRLWYYTYYLVWVRVICVCVANYLDIFVIFPLL